MLALINCYRSYNEPICPDQTCCVGQVPALGPLIHVFSGLAIGATERIAVDFWEIRVTLSLPVLC